jgi:hypothetical protein
MTAVVIALMLIIAHGALSIVMFTLPKRAAVFYRFYLPSFLLAWVGYIGYEYVYIPRNCSGECNIRVDLLFIYPYLAFVTICALVSFVRSQRTNTSSSQ